MKMNKLAILSMMVCLSLTAGAALANDIFEPVSTGYSYVETPAPVQQTAVTEAPIAVDTNLIAATDTLNTVTPIATDNYQGAITYIENEQVELRTKLQGLNTKYTEIDQQYKTVTLERKNAKKAIKETEKKIKTLEKTKEKLKKENSAVK